MDMVVLIYATIKANPYKLNGLHLKHPYTI